MSFNILANLIMMMIIIMLGQTVPSMGAATALLIV